LYTDCTFQGRRVVISGQRFERCTFVNCELVFDGKPTQLISCNISGCNWAFEGAAGETLGFVSAMCANSPELSMMIARAIGFVHEQPN
jgi:hypothetical protein